MNYTYVHPWDKRKFQSFASFFIEQLQVSPKHYKIWTIHNTSFLVVGGGKTKELWLIAKFLVAEDEILEFNCSVKKWNKRLKLINILMVNVTHTHTHTHTFIFIDQNAEENVEFFFCLISPILKKKMINLNFHNQL